MSQGKKREKKKKGEEVRPTRRVSQKIGEKRVKEERSAVRIRRVSRKKRIGKKEEEIGNPDNP